MRFAAAVDNMPQGLSMFDADRRLVICNANYAKLYNLPPHLVRPGTLLTDILSYRIEHGPPVVGGSDLYAQTRIDTVAAGKPQVSKVDFEDGRTISVIHHPMPDGGWVSTHEDITEQRSTELRIHHLARHDPLTDLPNRLMFQEAMKGAELRIRQRQVLAVLAIDLDHFKAVNDTGGHAAGDALLKQVAETIRDTLAPGDLLARLGGDEFAVVLDSAATVDAETAARAIIESVRMLEFEWSGQSHRIGASIGLAPFGPDCGEVDEIIARADAACYAAKAAGRGRALPLAATAVPRPPKRRATEGR
jgi:diguanylate cyclase (GGDEF)-like protein